MANEPQKWADPLGSGADVNTIPEATPAGTGAASMRSIFPPITQVPLNAGGIAPDRADFNGLFKLLGDNIFYQQQGGVYSYSATIDYAKGSLVKHNGKIYVAIQANGPATVEKEPGEEPDFWQEVVLSNTGIIAADTTTARSLENRFADVVNVKDFGAKGDGVTDDTNAILAACEKGSLYIPDGNFLFTISSDSDLSVFIDGIENALIIGSLTVKLEQGHFVSTKPIVLAGIGSQNLKIIGDTLSATQIVSVGTATGQAGAWSLPVFLSDTSAVVGDYLLVTGDNSAVGDNAEMLRGVWEIVDVVGQTVTIKHTAWQNTFPEISITSGYAYIVKTVVQFENCDGLVVRNSALGMLDNCVFAGNASDYWSAGDVAGTEKGTHGVHVGNATIAQSKGNPHGLGASAVYLGGHFGVSDFDQQGIVASCGCTIYARWASACSNRRRGFYAETCGSIQCKNSHASGNYLDGYIADFTGSIVCNLSDACGNGQNGFNAINGGSLSASRSLAIYNGSSGYMCIGTSHIYAVNGFASHNAIDGVHAEYGASVFVNNCIANNNGNDGFEAIAGAIIRGESATASNNGRYGFRVSSNGVILSSTELTGTDNIGGIKSAEYGVLADSSGYNGIKFPNNFFIGGRCSIQGNDLRVENASHYFKISLSAAGDTYFGVDNNPRWLMKNAGDLYPVASAEYNIGSPSYLVKALYASTGTIQTSDERAKQDISEIPEVVFRAWSKVKFSQFVFADAYEQKGKAARLHFGLMAQNIKEAFESEGLDGFKYGLLCYDTWEDQYEEITSIDENGIEHIDRKLVQRAGNAYGIRYTEALALECAYQRWLGAKREARIKALEAKLK